MRERGTRDDDRVTVALRWRRAQRRRGKGKENGGGRTEFIKAGLRPDQINIFVGGGGGKMFRLPPISGRVVMVTGPSHFVPRPYPETGEEKDHAGIPPRQYKYQSPSPQPKILVYFSSSSFFSSSIIVRPALTRPRVFTDVNHRSRYRSIIHHLSSSIHVDSSFSDFSISTCLLKRLPRRSPPPRRARLPPERLPWKRRRPERRRPLPRARRRSGTRRERKRTLRTSTRVSHRPWRSGRPKTRVDVVGNTWTRPRLTRDAVLKQVHPDTGISNRAMSILNSFVNGTWVWRVRIP